jgi:hypothetical protein
VAVPVVTRRGRLLQLVGRRRSTYWNSSEVRSRFRCRAHAVLVEVVEHYADTCLQLDLYRVEKPCFMATANVGRRLRIPDNHGLVKVFKDVHTRDGAPDDMFRNGWGIATPPKV